MFKKIFLAVVLTLLTHGLAMAWGKGSAPEPKESDQQISEFSLAGYGEKGKKTWDLSGKSADIFTEVVKLNEIAGNLYGEKESIKLTADRGDFDRIKGKVHLEQNVVITTSSGAKLITDSLDWDRQKELVTTKDKVNIARQNMYATALGAMGQPSLSRVTLKKEVQVDINQEPPKDKPDSEGTKTTITCDGPLEIDYTKSVATFRNNVLVVTQGNQIYSDAMDVYFMPSAKTQEAEEAKKARMEEAEASLEKIVARGNVKIVKGENVSYSDEAIYTVADKKILLTGRPKLVIYQTEKLDASAGN